AQHAAFAVDFLDRHLPPLLVRVEESRLGLVAVELADLDRVLRQGRSGKAERRGARGGEPKQGGSGENLSAHARESGHPESRERPRDPGSPLARGRAEIKSKQGGSGENLSAPFVRLRDDVSSIGSFAFAANSRGAPDACQGRLLTRCRRNCSPD